MPSKFRPRFHSLNPLIIKVVMVGVLVMASALAAVACSDDTTSKNTFDIGTGPLTTKTKDPISKEAIETMINRKLGDAGVAGQPVIRNIALTPEAGGTFVNMELNRTSTCHAGALVGTAVTMAQQTMSAIFRYPDVSRVQLTLYGPTEAAADKDKQAVRIMVTKDAAGKIDWFQFTEKTAPTLASEYWIEPAVLANFQQYGSAPITDPALLEQATGGTATTPAP